MSPLTFLQPIALSDVVGAREDDDGGVSHALKIVRKRLTSRQNLSIFGHLQKSEKREDATELLAT